MTQDELKRINEHDIETPFRVLSVENKDDLVFLRKKCVDVEKIKDNNDLQHLIERMITTMDLKSGVGIAAPQIGIGRNLILFLRIDDPDYPVQIAINPKIVAHSEETFDFEGDGCLSVPGKSGTTKRYRWIDVEYWDDEGELIKERLNGGSREEDFTGIIFQHEYDHLQGTLFIDRLIKENTE